MAAPAERTASEPEQSRTGGDAGATGRGLGDEAAAARRAARFGTLPRRVEPAEMVEETPAEAPHDPNFGRNPDNDWMVRYSA